MPQPNERRESRRSSGKVVVRPYFPVVGILDISDHNTNDKYDSHWCHCPIIGGDMCICVLFDSSGSLPLIDMNLLPLQPSQELPSS
ncbi:Uridine kinase [Trichinella spiralis]|uniref:Uridine kinase n=1 Tax=Trichinella spiralis TaxID=6334 RepID=A0ABR3KD68_TRISP